MANYNDLITAIDSVIKTNNRREITGQLLQNVLNTMVGSLGENYQLAGFATPTTNPHQPDQNVFYVASQAGVYTQFDNIVLGDGISFLMWKNGAWTSQTISNVTQSWVQQNFVSKEWFRKVFRVYDEDGLEIVPNDMDSVVDNIKAMVGLWTNEYLSALGMGRDGGGTTQTLAQLNDVQLGTLANGDALVYNTAIHKWENKQIQTGVDMSVVWAALAANTNDQINASHLATALSGYVTSANLSTILNDYATKTWVNQNFITVEWFDKLFQLYNGTEAEANKIAPNGALPVDQTQLNIEAMFGFWTKKYISSLGQGDDGTTSYTTLAQLNDVTLTNPTANQILVFDGTHWRNQNQQSVYELPVATTTTLGGIMLGYAASGKNYAIQLDANGKAYVNVPWSDTIYTLPTASADNLGGVKIGYITDATNRNYAVQLSSEKMYVNVPWENTWRGIQNNLTSDSTTDSLSAAQGKALKGYIDTLNGYFSNGVAKSAAKLTTVSKTLFGNTYWTSDGVPTSIGVSGSNASLSYVQNISMSGYIKIGDAYLTYDSTNNAIRVSANADGTGAMNFYARGGVSALGETADGQAGVGDVTWALLATQATDGRTIHLSYISAALSSYLTTNGYLQTSAIADMATQTWVGQQGFLTSIPAAMESTLGGIKIGYTTSGKNYKVQLDASNNAYVNVPWTDTTYTLAGLMGSTAKGSTTQPIYWNGSEFVNTSYTLGKSVPSDAVFTDHYDWSDITNKPLTLTKNATGFSISGGVTSKTLTVGADYTLGAACAKGVTDNSSNADVTSSDTNLITGRTLYYQLAKKGYTTNTGTVTSVETGTGLTGGTITTSGTISINSTYQNYIANGNTAYGWGNHANAGYASASSLSNYLPLAGGTMTGAIILSGSQLPSYNSTGKAKIGEFDHTGGMVIQLGSTASSASFDIINKAWDKSLLSVSSEGDLFVNGSYVQIGQIKLVYDSDNNAIKVIKSDGTNASLYATGGISALGANTESGGNYLPLSGGTMSGTINITTSSHDIIRAVDSIYSKYVFATSASGGEYAVIHGFNRSDFYTTGGSLNLYGTNGVSIGNWDAPTMFIQANNGNVGIGTTPSDSKLTVNGDINTHSIELYFSTPFIDFHYNNSSSDYTSRIIEYSAGTLTCEANLRAFSYANTSDIRLKNKIKDVEIPLEIIARAPAFQFTWKNPKMGGGYHIGTSAQYWQSCVSEFVDFEKDEMGTLSMQYGVAALISAISIAKKVVNHEEEIALLKTRVSALESENGEQEMLINSLQEELSKFKAA